jgi:predicted glycosyltransferase
LSRTGKLAAAVRGAAVCLVASGRPDARHLIPVECDYAIVPGLEAVLSLLIPRDGRPPSAEAPPQQVLTMRRDYLTALVAKFDPDVIVADHRPEGVHGELRDILEQSRARKIAVLRPVPADDGVRAIHELGIAELHRRYDAVLVAGDRRTALVDQDLGFDDRAEEWRHHIGYVSLPVSPEEIEVARQQRGLRPQDPWVVCSAGSGFYHPVLIQECLELAREFTEIQFDLALGSDASSTAETIPFAPPADGRVRLVSDRQDLRVVHAAADVVICHGGYNTLTEAMEGGARLIVDTRGDLHRERARHLARLEPYYPVLRSEGLPELRRHLHATLSRTPPRRSIRARGTLDFDGCQAFARIVSAIVGRAAAIGPDRHSRV